jgi:hypothetical protein
MSIFRKVTIPFKLAAGFLVLYIAPATAASLVLDDPIVIMVPPICAHHQCRGAGTHPQCFVDPPEHALARQMSAPANCAGHFPW